MKAVDRNALNEAFGTPGSEIAFGPFSKDHPWYVKTDYPTYDVAGAKKGAFNFERFKNAELSSLLDKGRQAASEAERREAYTAAAVIIGREVPISFGTFGGSWVAVSSKVTGMDQFKTFVFPTRHVGLSA